jgi:hypothetical protein
MNGDEPMRDFKKNRNITALGPNININPNVNFSNMPSPAINSPTLPPSLNNMNITNQNSNQSVTASSTTTSSTNNSSTNPNMMSPSNNKLINQVYVMEGQKSPSNYSKESRISE